MSWKNLKIVTRDRQLQMCCVIIFLPCVESERWLIRKTGLDIQPRSRRLKSDRCEGATLRVRWVFTASSGVRLRPRSLFTQSRTPSRWPCRLRTHAYSAPPPLPGPKWINACTMRTHIKYTKRTCLHAYILLEIFGISAEKLSIVASCKLSAREWCKLHHLFLRVLFHHVAF